MARTKADIEDDLAEWYAALREAAKGKSFTISTSSGTRTVTKQDVGEIKKTINDLNMELQRVTSGAGFALANFDNDLSR